MTKAELFKGRELTDFERKMREEHRGICCGQPVEKSTRRWRDNTIVDWWPFECTPCRDMGSTHPTGTFDQFTRGAARASVKQEHKRRLGYRVTTASGPHNPVDEEDERRDT